MGDERPIWKKEISFSRKPRSAERAETEVDRPAEEPSIWKRELSFGRGKGDGDAQPFWKKEISLGRGKEKSQRPERARPGGEAATPFWKQEIAVGRRRRTEVARLADEAARAILAAPEEFAPAPAPAPIEPELLADAVASVEVTPPAPEPVAAEPDPGVEIFYQAPPAPAVPVPEPVAAAPRPAPVPEPWEAEPVVPPAPEPAPQQIVHPPVPAAQLPPLGGVGSPAVPWWKKELAIGRRSSKPLPEDDDAPRTRWWKKELGGAKRKPQPAVAANADPVAPAQSAKTPWWKKEIGGRKKEAPAVAATAEPAAPKPKPEPFWKRGPALGLPPLPSRPSGGGKGKKNAKLKKVVGLKVGASQLAAARIENNGVAQLVQVARQPLEQGVVVGGELRDQEALAEQLKSFFARNKLPRRNVRLGIASNRIGVRIFDVAGIDNEKALANAIQFRAQEALPIPLDEAVLDYHVLGESVDEDGQQTRRILLVVAYRELVDRYIAACRKAGISLVGIDLEAFALLRALAAPRPEDVEASAALVGVAIGHDRSTFAVSDGRTCEFTRVLEWGGGALSVALARALDLAPSEVEGIKRTLSLLPGADAPEGLAPEQHALALDAVRKGIQTFARELVSSLQFYQNQPGSLGIGEIVLTGGTAHLGGLADELQRMIGVRVRVGDPLARLKVAKKVRTPEQLGSFAVAIGLGIED